MAGEDKAYSDWIHRQPCCAAELGPCRAALSRGLAGPCWGMRGIIQDHVGRRWYGTRSHDHESIPLCQGHDAARIAHDVPFRDKTKGWMREWMDKKVAEMRSRYERGIDSEEAVPW